MLTQMEYDELVKFRDGPVQTPDGPTPMILHLKAGGYVEPSDTDVRPGLSIVYTEWVITIPGRVALQEFEQRLEDHRKQARQQSFQNKVSVASVLVPAVTFILGLIVEHGFGLVGVVLDLLG